MSGAPLEPAGVVRQVFDAFRRRDVDALLALVDARVEFHPVTAMVASEGRPCVGHEGMVAYLADVDRVWDSVDVTVDELRAGDDPRVVVGLGRVHAHGGGRVIDSPAGWLWRLEGGRVVYGRVFETRAAALEAAGLPARDAPSPGF